MCDSQGAPDGFECAMSIFDNQIGAVEIFGNDVVDSEAMQFDRTVAQGRIHRAKVELVQTARVALVRREHLALRQEMRLFSRSGEGTVQVVEIVLMFPREFHFARTIVPLHISKLAPVGTVISVCSCWQISIKK